MNLSLKYAPDDTVNSRSATRSDEAKQGSKTGKGTVSNLWEYQCCFQTCSGMPAISTAFLRGKQTAKPSISPQGGERSYSVEDVCIGMAASFWACYGTR